MKKITLFFLLLTHISYAQMPFVLDTVLHYPYGMYAGTSYAQHLVVDTIKFGHFKFTLMPPQYNSTRVEVYPAYHYFSLKKGAKPTPNHPKEHVRIDPPKYNIVKEKRKIGDNPTFLLELKSYKECLSYDPRYGVRYGVVEDWGNYPSYQIHYLVEPAKIIRKIGKKQVVEVLDSSSTFLEAVEVPPQYGMIKTHDFRKQHYRIEADFDFRPYLSDWNQIICCYTKITSPTVVNIQQALLDRGYNVKVSNVMDRKTKKALRKYQSYKGLPVGNLNIETLKSLGLSVGD
jgi:hypothetical protein